MKRIKGFENEDIIVSDFGEWVGKNYIDYKSEYKRNQKFIEMLFDENKQLKEKVNKLEILIENLKLGVTLNQEQEDLLDEILFRESRE